MTKKRLNERTVGGKHFLSRFEFKIEYRQEKKEGKPDAMTRGPGDLAERDNERKIQVGQMILPQLYCEDTKIETIELFSMYNKKEAHMRNI